MKLQDLLRELLFEEYYEQNVFLNKTRIPDYDKLLNKKYDELPSKYSNLEAHIELMTPNDYFNRCAEIQHTTYDKQFNFIVPSKVEKYKEMMENGSKFDMPYLNYSDISQEGRHRVKAAMDLNVSKIPVLIITEKDDENEEGYTLDDMIGKWNDLSKDKDGNFIINFGQLIKWEDVSRFLSSIAKGFDSYFLDDIMDVYKYYKGNYIILINKDNTVLNSWKYKQIIRMIEMKCDIETLTENIEGIKKLDETELKILLYKSLWLKIMEHNDHELSTISNFKHNSTHTIIKLNKTYALQLVEPINRKR